MQCRFSSRFGPALTLGVFIQSNTPPVFIIHGDAERVVPIYQAGQFVRRCQEMGVKPKLVVREGTGYGWAGMAKDLPLFTDRFE